MIAVIVSKCLKDPGGNLTKIPILAQTLNYRCDT